jgi:hypothetical protein
MKKKFLHHANLVLGALSLALAGCHSAKQAASPKEPVYMVKYGVPTEQVMPKDSTPTPQPQRPDIIVTKYGIPAPLLEQ